MSGDTSATKPEIIELQEHRIGRVCIDKGVQCDEFYSFEPLRIASLTETKPCQLKEFPSTQPIPGATASTHHEEEIQVVDSIPQPASQKEGEEKAANPESGRIIEYEEDPGCLIQCLYYTDKCCECIIL